MLRLRERLPPKQLTSVFKTSRRVNTVTNPKTIRTYSPNTDRRSVTYYQLPLESFVES